MPTPFGNVAFEASRMSPTLDDGDTTTNGERAKDGETTLALFCNHADRDALRRYAAGANLTEAPEEALATLLGYLMHYCHREGIEWFGQDGVSQVALRNFSRESGGAVL